LDCTGVANVGFTNCQTADDDCSHLRQAEAVLGGQMMDLSTLKEMLTY
jgi:hypothetical protein